MNLSLITNTQAALSVVAAPSSIPPAPESGVVLTARASTSSPARPAAPPCAQLWPAQAAALHASQVLDVAVDEIDWLYENTDDETDPVCVRARASIEGWLAELSPDHQAAIALHHDATPWPEDLPGHEGDSFALALYVLLPTDERSLRFQSFELLCSRARSRVDVRIERDGQRGLRALIRSARWLYEDAVRAYAQARGRVAKVLPEGSAAFASDFDEEALG